MPAVIFCENEVVGIFMDHRKARAEYMRLFSMGILTNLVDRYMEWTYFVSPPVAWESVYAIVLPNGKVYSFHRTMESAQQLVKDVFIDCPEPMIREMIMEW